MIETIFWGGFYSDPCEDHDYEELIPESDQYRHRFDDGSVIILTGDEPIVEGKYDSMANHFADRIEENQLSDEEAIKLLEKNIL